MNFLAGEVTLKGGGDVPKLVFFRKRGYATAIDEGLLDALQEASRSCKKGDDGPGFSG